MSSIISHNRNAWDREAELKNPATVPVDDGIILRARRGEAVLSMTGGKLLPPSWLKDIGNKRVLCVALGGGQQVPILAAMGAEVTSLDNSPRQLRSDEETAVRFGMSVRAELGDMQDLGRFDEGSFDVAMLGLGMQFVPYPSVVWKELARVIAPNGTLIASLVNPIQYIFEWPQFSARILKVAHSLPYSDVGSLSEDNRIEKFGTSDPLEFGHTFEMLLGGAIEAGFALTGFIEDNSANDALSEFIANYFVFRAHLIGDFG
ncbi:class I SAM-dependent methyltransferase [Rhizobium ruizarguesonis]